MHLPSSHSQSQHAQHPFGPGLQAIAVYYPALLSTWAGSAVPTWWAQVLVVGGAIGISGLVFSTKPRYRRRFGWMEAAPLLMVAPIVLGSFFWGLVLGLAVAAPVAMNAVYFDLITNHEGYLQLDDQDGRRMWDAPLHDAYTTAILLGAFARAGLSVAGAGEYIVRVYGLGSVFGPQTAAAPMICLLGPLAVVSYLFNLEQSPRGLTGKLFGYGPFMLLATIGYGVIPRPWVIGWAAKLLMMGGAVWACRGIILAAARPHYERLYPRHSAARMREPLALGLVGFPAMIATWWGVSWLIGHAAAPSGNALLFFRAAGLVSLETVLLIARGRLRRPGEAAPAAPEGR